MCRVVLNVPAISFPSACSIQDGLFKTFDQGDDANFKYRRYNFRANLDVDFSKLSTLSIGIGGRIGRRNSIGNGEYNGQSGVFGVEGLLNNGTPMSGYGLDSEDIALFPTLTLLARLAPMVSVLSTSTVILFNARMS